MDAPALAVVADDLSGAAECAVHALMRVSRSYVTLSPSPDAHGNSTAATPTESRATVVTVVTVDTDSRRRGADAAVRAVRAAAPLVAPAATVVKKVDSLLRGHVGVEVAALAEELQRVPVVAVANPSLRRVVRDGVLHVGDTPLHETDLWAVEAMPAPTTVAEALLPLRTVSVPQATDARGVDAVAEALARARTVGLVAVCDAATESDLEVIHAAATRTPMALLVGSGAIAAVAAHALPDEVSGPVSDAHAYAGDPRPGRGVRPLGPAESVLFVLGTRAPGLADQLAHLVAEHRAHAVLVQPDTLLDDPEAVRVQLAGHAPLGVVVVALDPTAPTDATRSRGLTESLADVVAPVADVYDALFLSGGETARAVLDRLGVRELEVVGEVETGTVVSTRAGGGTVVTRPGSFGVPDSLVRVATHLLGRDHPAAASPAAAPAPTTTSTTSAPTKEIP